MQVHFRNGAEGDAPVITLDEGAETEDELHALVEKYGTVPEATAWFFEPHAAEEEPKPKRRGRKADPAPEREPAEEPAPAPDPEPAPETAAPEE